MDEGSAATNLDLNIVREKGTFGVISITYQVSSSSMFIGCNISLQNS